MIMHRRTLITGLASLIAAPAVARVAPLMPIKVWRPAPISLPIIGFRCLSTDLEIAAGFSRYQALHIRVAPLPEPLIGYFTSNSEVHPDIVAGEIIECRARAPGEVGDILMRHGLAALARWKRSGGEIADHLWHRPPFILTAALRSEAPIDWRETTRSMSC